MAEPGTAQPITEGTAGPAGPAGAALSHQVTAGPATQPTGEAVATDERTAGRGRLAAAAAVTVLVVGVLGAPLGWLWSVLAPATPVVKSGDGAVYGQAQPEQPIAADGWFSLLGLLFGVLVALAVWLLLRRHRGPVGLVVAVAGGLAAALVAWQVGRRIGLAEYQRLLDTAPDGTRFSKPVDLRAGGIDLFLGVLPMPYGNLLLAAFAAAVTYTLLAGWSRWPSLRPEPEPDGAWLAAYPSWPAGSAGGVSSGPAGATPAPPAAPEPPAPGAAEPPRG
ncbi:DUF2567 domain-containing protein [Micromonospora sp. CP22]|nr:DUF2567 domain-containing protein [Micromonospora sp. CP22]